MAAKTGINVFRRNTSGRPLDSREPSKIAQERALPLLPGAQRANSGVVAFVQNRRTAEVLQVLMLPSCA